MVPVKRRNKDGSKKEIDLDISSSSCKSIGKDKSTFIRVNEKYIVSLKKNKEQQL